MRKTKTIFTGVIAAICLCVCAVIIFNVEKKAPASNIDVSGGIVYYSDIGLGNQAKIEVPANCDNGRVFFVVLRNTSDGLVKSQGGDCGENPTSVKIDVPQLNNNDSQDYYVCLTGRDVREESFVGKLDNAIKDIRTDAATFEINIDGEKIVFYKLTVKYVENTMKVTNVTVNGVNISTAPYISDDREVVFEVTSYNPMDKSAFDNENGKCKAMGTDDGTIIMNSVEETTSDDGTYKYNVKCTFKPREKWYNDYSNVHFTLMDKTGQIKWTDLHSMKGEDNPGIGEGYLRVDTLNVTGEFDIDEGTSEWSKDSPANVKMYLRQSSSADVDYLSAIKEEDLTVENSGDFENPPSIKLKKVEDEMYAEITVTCDEDKVVDNNISVRLNINRDRICINKVFTSINHVKIDRAAPKIITNERSFKEWRTGGAFLIYDVTDEGSGDIKTGGADGTKTKIVKKSDKTGWPDKYSYEIPIPNNGVLESASFTIIAIDQVGNYSTYDIKDLKVMIDNAKPTVKVVEARTYKPGSDDGNDPGDALFDLNKDWIREPVKIKLDINDKGSGVDLAHLNKDILGIENAKNIGFNTSSFVEKDDSGKITAVYMVINPLSKPLISIENNESNPTYSGKVKFILTDIAGNSCDETLMHVNIDVKAPYINEIRINKADDDGSGYLSNKDKIKIEVDTTDNKGSGAGYLKMKLIGRDDYIVLKPKPSSNDNITFEGEIDTGWMKNGGRVLLKEIFVSDNAGNKITYDYGKDGRDYGLVYMAPMDISKMELNYNNGKRLVKNGDEILVDFKPGRELEDNGKVSTISIGSRKGDLSWFHDDGIYKGYYTVEDMPENDNGEFDINIFFHDKAGNELRIDNALLGQKIKYYAPIEESIYDLSFVIKDSDKRIARNGDVVRVSFKTKHPVTVSNAKIANRDVQFSSNGSYEHTAEIKLEDGMVSDNNAIPYSFELSDEAGNSVYRVDQGKTGALTYYAPLNVHDIKMTSNNENTANTGAKNGDSLTVSFVTNHPAEVKEASIGGQGIDFTSGDRMNWSGTVNTTEGMTSDMGYIPLHIVVGDEAGNDVVRKSENDLSTQKVKYVAPISITGVSMESSNEKEPKKAAKSGDTVTVSFMANHNVTITNAKIGGKDASLSVTEAGGEKRKYELTCSFSDDELADRAQIHFSFDASDMAGNPPASISDGTLGASTLTYYAPITTEASIASNSKHSEYVRNGGKVIITGEANHPVTVEKCKIMGRTVEGTKYAKNEYSVAYEIPEGESKLAESEVTFEYTLTDDAGNELKVNKVTDKSKVLYDRTQPVIEADYDKVNFTNSTVDYVFTFSDENLSAEDLSIKVNGEEQITDDERSSFKGTYFVKEISVDSDDNYKITADAADLAGNSAEPAVINMTVDKTAPQIKTVSISTDKPKIFGGPFSIKDHLEIDEANLKEIICTVTNSNGTTDWDINDPVTAEGKNTINIMATDMADNTSESVTYDIYIDTTPPKPVVAEKKRNLFVYSDKQAVFNEDAELEISLEPLHIEGVSEPDHFTKLVITDDDGEVIYDLLSGGYESADNKGAYFIAMSDKGEFYIVLEAEDEVGNKTGEMKYKFRIKEKGIMPENDMAVAAIATAGGVVAIATGYVLVFKRVRRKRLG